MLINRRINTLLSLPISNMITMFHFLPISQIFWDIYYYCKFKSMRTIIFVYKELNIRMDIQHHLYNMQYFAYISYIANIFLDIFWLKNYIYESIIFSYTKLVRTEIHHLCILYSVWWHFISHLYHKYVLLDIYIFWLQIQIYEINYFPPWCGIG